MGVLEDSLMQMNELIFLDYFYVRDMKDDPTTKETSLLLGIPFMRAPRKKMIVQHRNLTMEFNGEVINFNIFEEMSNSKYLLEVPIRNGLIIEDQGDQKRGLVIRKYKTITKEPQK